MLRTRGLYLLHLGTVVANTLLVYSALVQEYVSLLPDLFLLIAALCMPFHLWGLLRGLVPREPAVEDSLVEDLAPMLIIGYGIGLVAVFEYLWELPWIPKPSGVLWMAFCLIVSLRFFRRTWQ